MPRTLAPATAADVRSVTLALYDLRQARDKLRTAGAPAALAKVNSAIKSTEGALRHVERRERATLA